MRRFRFRSHHEMAAWQELTNDGVTTFMYIICDNSQGLFFETHERSCWDCWISLLLERHQWFLVLSTRELNVCWLPKMHGLSFNPYQPRVFGVRFSLREVARIFSIKIRNFKLRKMLKLLSFRFPEGWYFLNCYNSELKRFSKINFSVSERHRWAVVG